MEFLECESNLWGIETDNTAITVIATTGCESNLWGIETLTSY